MVHLPFDGPRGAEDNVACFAEALLGQGWGVEIVCSRWNARAFEGRLDQFTPRLVPWPRLSLLGRADTRARDAIVAAISDCDIAMAHNHPASCYLGLARVAIPRIWYCQEPQRRLHALETAPGLRRGIASGSLDPSVPGNRELARKQCMSRWKRIWSPQHRGRRRLDIEGVQGLDAIWANSAATARQAEAIFCRRPDVFYMAVEIPEDLPSAAPARGPMRILTMGGFAPVKGLALLLAGFAHVCRLHPGEAILEIVGGGVEQPQFEAHVAALGIAENVRFHGRLPPSALKALRAECHAFAATPVDEPFGLVFAEAAAAGLIMIAPDHGGPRETTLDGKAGILVDIFDAEAVSGALSRLLRLSFDERERLRRAAFNGAKARFDLAQLGGRLSAGLKAHLDYGS